MIRKTLIALLLAALPAAHAVAGSVDLSNRAVMRGPQVSVTNGYATYLGDRWQPITIHLDQPALGSSLVAGLSSPRRVTSGSALYTWTQGHVVRSPVSMANSIFSYGWGSGRHWYEADADSEDSPIPAWHGHGHGHGPGTGGGGGSDDGGGVSAVPLPAAFPLLLSALALLGLALRGASRD
jgi:hypothetical protein